MDNFPTVITHNKEIIYKKYTTDYLYSDKIPLVLYARNRKDGDVVLSCGVNKSIKRLMCQHKIPSEDRFSIPVIYSEDGNILLVPMTAKSDLFSKKKDGCHVISIALYRRI